MSHKEALLNEVKAEAANTRKILERVPEAHFAFQPHEKSMTLQRLAAHVAEIPHWATRSLTTDDYDMLASYHKPNQIHNHQELLALHDKNVQEALDAISAAGDDEWAKTWTLRRGEHVIIQLPKAVVTRTLCCNHLYHHRGQLSVYLRLLDVPVPGIYGPSADDIAAMAAKN